MLQLINEARYLRLKDDSGHVLRVSKLWTLITSGSDPLKLYTGIGLHAVRPGTCGECRLDVCPVPPLVDSTYRLLQVSGFNSTGVECILNLLSLELAPSFERSPDTRCKEVSLMSSTIDTSAST